MFSYGVLLFVVRQPRAVHVLAILEVNDLVAVVYVIRQQPRFFIKLFGTINMEILVFERVGVATI